MPRGYYEHYPIRPEDDTAYPYLRASRYALHIFGNAQSRLFLSQPREVEHALYLVRQETINIEIEPVTKLDFFYYQAQVQYQHVELEASVTTLQEAGRLAKSLGSRLYFGKLLEVYETVRAKWPHERPVIELEDVFRPWQYRIWVKKDLISRSSPSCFLSGREMILRPEKHLLLSHINCNL